MFFYSKTHFQSICYSKYLKKKKQPRNYNELINNLKARLFNLPVISYYDIM